MKNNMRVLYILGSGIIRSKRAGFGYEPSRDGKLRALAGAYLFLQRKVCRLVFTGGKVLGSEHPSVAFVMKVYVKGKFDIHEEVIGLQEEAMDTVQEIKRIKKLQKGREEILIVSNEFHLPRIRLIANKLGVSFKTLSAEGILLKISKEKEKAERFLSSLGCKKQRQMEKKKIKQLGERFKTDIPHRQLDNEGRIRNNL